MVGMSLIDDTLEQSADLIRNINQTKYLVHSLLSAFEGREHLHLKPREDVMDSIRDAMIQTGNGRKIVVQVNEEMRARAIKEENKREKARKERMALDAIRGRVRSLKDLVHYTFVEYPAKFGYKVRFDVYHATKEGIRKVGKEGGENYDALIRTLQFAPTSKKAFDEAITSLMDIEHDFNAYDSSDAVIRHG
jgi:hypothetical protein